MRTVTVGVLVTRIQQRADVENFASPTTTEIKGLISAAYPWLRDLLVKSGLAFFESTDDWTADGITADHTLPASFYGVLRVDEVQSPRLRRLEPIDIRQIDGYDLTTGTAAVAYRIIGVGATGKVTLYPRPPQGQVYRLTYIPIAEDLSAAADATTIDGINGYEELIVIACALKIMQKHDRRRPDLERAMEMELGRIEEMRANRELLKTGTIEQIDGSDQLPSDVANWWYQHPFWSEF